MKTSEILSIVALISLGLGAITHFTSKILHKTPGNTVGVKLFIFIAICCVAISGLLTVTSEKMSSDCSRGCGGDPSAGGYGGAKWAFSQGICECTGVVTPEMSGPYHTLGDCCSANPSAGGECGSCSTGGGNCPTIPGVKYPAVSIGSTTFSCCDNGNSTVACNGDENGTALCGLYERASQNNATEKDLIQIGWKNGQPVNQLIVVTPQQAGPDGAGFPTDGNIPPCSGKTKPSRHHHHTPSTTKWTQSSFNKINNFYSDGYISHPNGHAKLLCLSHAIVKNFKPSGKHAWDSSSSKNKLNKLISQCNNGGWNHPVPLPDGLHDVQGLGGGTPVPGTSPVPGPAPSPGPGPGHGPTSSTMSTEMIIGIIGGGVVFVGIVMAAAIHFNGVNERGSKASTTRIQKRQKRK